MSLMLITVEQELINATGFEPEKVYRDRQDYLSSLLEACCNLKDDEFETLSDDAADWANAAAIARKKKQTLPDFDGGENVEDNQDSSPPDLHAEAPENVVSLEAVTGNKAAPKRTKGKRGPPMKKLTGELDEFGVAKGTKTAQVIALLKQGVTMSEVKAQVGDTYYNLISRLEKKGHKVIREGKKITLICKE